MLTLEAAARAVYIDFECTKAEVARPALLGVVRPAGGFTQFIVDPGLADAARASADARPAAIQAVLRQLAGDLEPDDAAICAWSSFDLEVIRAAKPPQKVMRILQRRYRNALDVVPAWARTYGFRPAKAQFEARNQLQTFFALAGYETPWRYAHATPAKWIRHVRERMRAAGRRYRRVNSQTRRDWNNLLDYNRHDCFGLRHLVLRATAEMEKRRASLETTYSVRDARREIRFRIGSRTPSLGALLARYGAGEWAFLSARDPGLETLSKRENDRRQRALETMIRERGYTVLHGEGRDPQGRWPPEPSIFAIGIAQADARLLAREFGQWAIVAGTAAGPPRLVWCLDPGDDQNVNSQLPG